MFLSKLFKRTKNKVMVAIAGLTMVLGAGAAITTVAAAQQNEVVETKAATSASHTVYFSMPIWGTANMQIHYWGTGIDEWVYMTERFTNSIGEKVFSATLPSGCNGFLFGFNQNSDWKQSVNVESGFPSTDYQGYSLSGWDHDNIFTLGTWDVHYLTLSYDGNGAQIGSVEDQNIFGDIANTPRANGFTRAGYSFVSWNTSADGTGTTFEVSSGSITQEWGESQTPGSTITLYAQWDADVYGGVLIKLNAGHDDWHNYYFWNSETNSGWETNRIGAAITSLGDYWYYYDIEDLGFVPTSMILRTHDRAYKTGDIAIPSGAFSCSKYFEISASGDSGSITGTWKDNSITIAFNGNGSTSGSTASVAATYGSSVTLTANGFSKSGHNFLGWATSPSGSVVHAGGATLSASIVHEYYDEVGVGGTKTLYAIWESGESFAVEWAIAFNKAIRGENGGVCKSDGSTTTSSLVTAWGAQSTAYAALAGYKQYWLAEATKSGDSNVTTALAQYDYVCGKYGPNGQKVSGITDFLGRDPKPKSAGVIPGAPRQDQSPLTATLWIVLGAGILGLGAIGTAYFVSKKKKRHQA